MAEGGGKATTPKTEDLVDPVGQPSLTDPIVDALLEQAGQQSTLLRPPVLTPGTATGATTPTYTDAAMQTLKRAPKLTLNTSAKTIGNKSAPVSPTATDPADYARFTNMLVPPPVNPAPTVDLRALQTILEAITGTQQRSMEDAIAKLIGTPPQPRTDAPNSRTGAFLKEARHRRVTFGGTTSESVLGFIREVEQLQELNKLNSQDLKRVISELLVGGAAQWYRMHRDELASWPAVAAALKANYLGPDHDTRLSVLLHTRQQDPQEKVLHYISHMRAINADMETPLSDEALTKLIRSHVHPKIARAIVFQATPTMADLEKACLTAEHLVEQEKAYAPPTVEQIDDPLYGDTDAAASRKKKAHVHAVAVTEKKKAEKSTPAVASSEPVVEEAAAAPLKANDAMQSSLRPKTTAAPAVKMRKPEKDWQCKGCGLTGHYEANCPTTPKPFCFRCGKLNTMTQKCCAAENK